MIKYGDKIHYITCCIFIVQVVVLFFFILSSVYHHDNMLAMNHWRVVRTYSTEEGSRDQIHSARKLNKFVAKTDIGRTD